jgi:hypothetical protein
MRYQGGRTVKRAVPAGLAQEFRDRVARWEEFEGASTWIADINHYADVWVMPVVVA